jgi:hypothetical protein
MPAIAANEWQDYNRPRQCSEPQDEVEASQHRKRRVVVEGERSGKNDAAEQALVNLQNMFANLKGDHATEKKDVGSEDAE